MVEELIPIAMFIMIALIFFIVLYFRQRSRADMQQTIRLALERGTELTPVLRNLSTRAWSSGDNLGSFDMNPFSTL